MLNFFKKQTDLTVKEPKNDFKNKTTNELIEEIHETFYTEVDRLLAEAKIANSTSTDKQELIDKSERLIKLGFTKTKEVTESQEEILRIDNLKRENENKKELIEAINHFSFKYPHYKFITEDSVKKICEKYNLVYGTIDSYIGTVPDENLKHIEDFKIAENDECYQYNQWFSHGMIDSTRYRKYITKSEHDVLIKKHNNYDMGRPSNFMNGELNEICPLEIAAPLKDFDMKNRSVTDFKVSDIEIPDPVVLKPVIFNSKKYYLIVTAWGLEATDELVINPKHN